MKIIGAFTITQFTPQGSDKPKNRWHRVGTAFRHKDGQGYNIELHAIPVDGKIVLRAASLKDGDEGTGDGSEFEDDDIPF